MTSPSSTRTGAPSPSRRPRSSSACRSRPSRSRSSSRSGSSCASVVVREHNLHDENVVSADLRRERPELEADGDVVVGDDSNGRQA